MSLPLVNVTARINDQQGRPVGGAVVRMRLTTPEKYQGLIVPRETTGITDANGSAILRVFPNALGYEGSEYDVHVSFPGSNAGVCGSATSITAVRTIRAHAVVPNADCNLMDIINLPPYEQRGAGAVLATEVAGYAGEAASYADAAKSEADSAAAVKGEILALEQSAGAAKTAAQASASEASEYARQAGLSVGEVRDASAHFQSTVTAQVDTTAKRLTADAVTCITERQAVALGAIEERSGDALQDFTTAATQAQTLAVSTVATARENALHDVQDASDTATDSLREMAVEYEEDFLALTERSETAAKKAGCSAAAAAAAESKATAAADRSQSAAQGLERHRDDALAAANRAEAAEACVKADADRAETAANRCQLNVDVVTSSAQSAQKSAQAADASADLAKASADIALSAKIQTTEDRAYVEGVATSTKQAVVDAAATVINDDVIAAATAQATAEVNQARDAAQQALADTQTVKGDAVAAKVAAENARTGAEAARDEANQYALNAKAKADSAAETVANLDTELLAAVPKPIWNGTSLGFKNDSGTVDVPAVDVRGPTGAEGLAATIAVGTVAALEPTEAPLVTNTGTANAAVLNFSIPKGVKGDKGDTGDKGDKGDTGATPPLSNDYTAQSQTDALSVFGANAMYAELSAKIGAKIDSTEASAAISEKVSTTDIRISRARTFFMTQF